MATVTKLTELEPVLRPFIRPGEPASNYSYMPRGMVVAKEAIIVALQAAADITLIHTRLTLDPNFVYRLESFSAAMRSTTAVNDVDAFGQVLFARTDDTHVSGSPNKYRSFVGRETTDALGDKDVVYRLDNSMSEVLRGDRDDGPVMNFYLWNNGAAEQPAMTFDFYLRLFYYDIDQYDQGVMHTPFPVLNC